MNILVTGAKGFIGRNLVETLKCMRDIKDTVREIGGEICIYEYGSDSGSELLDTYTKECDVVVHLAGVNRPDSDDEFISGNVDFTALLLDKLKGNGNKAAVIAASSVWADGDTPYGRSKRLMEDMLFEYGRAEGVKTVVYRLPNVFGKWCKPNYNSVVATFCHNISRGLPIRVDDRNRTLTLAYIDDVVDELIRAIDGRETGDTKFAKVPVTHTATVGEIVDLLCEFKRMRDTKTVPDTSRNSLTKKLYSTYLTYVPTDKLAYRLDANRDSRGGFAEFIKQPCGGQISVNVLNPNEEKGNHWHHTKTEKFLVVSGRAAIGLRKVGTDKVYTYEVDGEDMTAVDIPPGYTHSIKNVSGTDKLVVVIWCNEVFDKENPDTFRETV